MKLLDQSNIKRKENAEVLSALLSKNIKQQKQKKGLQSIFLYYDIIVDGRREVKKKLLNSGIDTQESWNVSCSSLDKFRKYNCKCPISDQLEKKSLYKFASFLFLFKKLFIFFICAKPIAALIFAIL